MILQILLLLSLYHNIIRLTMVEKNDIIKNYNKKRRMHNILLNKRAGDGNRTHVFSLEG